MTIDLIIGLLQNAAILLAATLLYDFVWASGSTFGKIKNRIFVGIILGGVAVLLMLSSVKLSDGVVFDTRSVLMVISGLFFGPLATIIAGVIAALFRIYLGGAGLWMGLGTIFFAATTGLVWKHYRPNWRKGKYIIELTAVSILAHLFMLFSILLVKEEEFKIAIYKSLSIPALTIYPFFTVLVGIMLINRINNKKVRVELAKSEHRYHSFINMNRDMMFIKDHNHKYVVANKRFCEDLNKSCEEVIAKTDFDLFPKELAARFTESDNEVMNTGVTLFFEEIFTNKVSETMKFPINLEEGEIGVGAIVRDMTLKYKKREMQEVLLYLSRLSLVDTDLSTFLQKVHFHMKRVIKADNFYIALYHKNENKYSFPFYVDEYDKVDSNEMHSMENSLTEYIRITSRGAKITQQDEAEIAKSFKLETIGKYSPVWMGAPLLDSALKEVIGVAAVQDYNDENAYNEEDLIVFEIFANTIGVFIEKLTAFEKLKEAKEEAEKSNKLKTIFLSNMSHEIRTPLNGIIGFSDILMSDVKDSIIKEYVTIINKSAHTLLYSINDIMDIAKIESGQTKVVIDSFDLVALLNEIYLFFSKQPGVNDLRLTIPNLETFWFLSDKIKIQQIFINLVNNAIKFTPKGYVEFGFEVEPTGVLLFVKDTGVGIPKDDQENVFNRFTQVEESKTRVYGGTGLGLSIVREFTRILGGILWLKSEIGQGTEFFIQFKDEKDEKQSLTSND